MRNFSVAMMTGLALVAGPLWAEDRSLVVGNDPANPTSTVAVASEMNRAARALGAAGFATLDGSNLTTEALRDRLDQVLRDLAPTDTLVILLAGDFAQSAGQTWFLPPDMPTEPTLATIGSVAVNLATVLDVAALVPGRALVLLGHDGASVPLGRGLTAGLGMVTAPQGVAVVQGSAADLARFAQTGLGARGQSLDQMLRGAGGLSGSGYLPAAIPFRPDQAPTPTNQTAGQANEQAAAEAAAWAAAQSAGTIAGYDAYLSAHPRGPNAAAAQTERTRLRNDPTLLAQQAEDALALNRDQRRAIQRQLTLLGFDTRGVDGILGRGSRAAITAWQKSQNTQASGYLSAMDLQRLSAAADRRAAELEAEAAARQAQLDREDRSFWERSGASGDADGLRTYLRQYPDGLYADVATNRLAAIDLDRQNAAAAQDRAAWAQAEQANSPDGYAAYLDTFPQGAFAPEAQSRIDATAQPAQPAAQNAEDALGLNPVTRRMIEQRLTALDFDPGAVDGTFDDKTRRAIRRFQNARGQEVTGYIDQSAIVALLAGAVFGGGN